MSVFEKRVAFRPFEYPEMEGYKHAINLGSNPIGTTVQSVIRCCPLIITIQVAS